ncbi:MAG: aminotransferase class III-fold pyridoxal phosphate-dependent enzyme [Beijerinckiaceae bacterium]|jgi:acetylornithine/succinyldiaminopimelate/putrescine aminotransferase|nr:aminotransferase class III-fold pyridoxal phosphate-dependent enzyme [Beijerinckiaceae bacterium]
MSLVETAAKLPGKPAMISLEDAKNMPLDEVRKYTMEHLNPGQMHFLKLLGFDKILIDSAEGPIYRTRDGREILDFFGGFGSVAFGHNHPRIIAARKKFQDEQRQEICMAFMSQYAAALAKNLAAIAPGDLDMVFLGSSGSEAMEAALKVAEKAQGPAKSTIVYAENSFHGKTKGVLAVTDSQLYRSQFNLTTNTRKVPFADIEALRTAFEQDPSIGILVLETVQGGAGIIEAPQEYWLGVRKLCDEFGVLWVADEVQCGLGRTGSFFAFEQFGVIPDVTALAKSLGGSKCAMAAMISRRDVYMKAYGTPKTAMVHAHATFGGIGEACATTIEALHVLYDEGLIENSAVQGEYLISELNRLKKKYPTLIKDVRGRGLMVGVEFEDISRTMPFGLKQMVSLLDDKLKGSICGFVGALLLKKHDVLVAFTEYNRNVIRLEPPLIIGKEHVDRFIASLDDVLSGGIVGIVKDYISGVAMR